MKKEKSFKKGDIVRVKASDGQPIGSYMKVLSLTKKYVFCLDLSNYKIYYKSKENILKASMITICVSEEDYAKICSPCFSGWYKHVVSTKWEKVDDEHYDIVQIQTNTGKTAMFTYDKTKKTIVIVDRHLSKCVCYINVCGINVISKHNHDRA